MNFCQYLTITLPINLSFAISNSTKEKNEKANNEQIFPTNLNAQPEWSFGNIKPSYFHRTFRFIRWLKIRQFWSTIERHSISVSQRRYFFRIVFWCWKIRELGQLVLRAGPRFFESWYNITSQRFLHFYVLTHRRLKWPRSLSSARATTRART